MSGCRILLRVGIGNAYCDLHENHDGEHAYPGWVLRQAALRGDVLDEPPRVDRRSASMPMPRVPCSTSASPTGDGK